MGSSKRSNHDSFGTNAETYEQYKEFCRIPRAITSSESSLHSLFWYVTRYIVKKKINIRLGVYLTDLTFIEDGIPSVIKRTNLINFAKRAKTAEVIRDIQQYQNVPYPLKLVQDLQDYILNNMQAAGDVHEMYEKSLQVEPREREDEKITR